MVRISYWLYGFLSVVVFLKPFNILSKPITIKSHIGSIGNDVLGEEVLRQALHLKDSLQDYYQTDLAGTLLLEEFGFYLHFQGLNSVFKWSKNEFTNLYERNFHGFNFESFSFMRDSALYNYGGSGFWQNNSILSFFREDLGEWEFLYSTRSDLDLYHNAAKVHFLINDELYFIFNETLDQNRVAIESEWFIGKLKLSDLKYHPLKDNQEVILRLVQNNWYRGFDGDDFYISLNYIGQKINIIDKSALLSTEIPVINLSSIDFPFSSKWMTERIAFVVIQGNKFEFLDYELQKVGFLNLGILDNTLYDWQSLVKQSISFYWVLAFLTPILLFSLYFFRRNRYNNLQNNLQKGSFPFPGLLDLDGQIVSQKHLHEVLGIDSNLSNDSIRTKRARILREINLLYGEFVNIERIEDHSDRRIFNYKVRINK